MKVLLAVPTRGHVWYETAQFLGPYNPQYVKDKLSVANCRNKIVRDFLQTEAEALIMCDDDVVPGNKAFIDVLAESPYDITGAPVPIAMMPDNEVFLNVFRRTEKSYETIPAPESGHVPCDAVGTGLVSIHRRVLEHPNLRRPFEQQLDSDGVIKKGQDLRFCDRAREAGFTIGANYDVVCDHLCLLHANSIQVAYRGYGG